MKVFVDECVDRRLARDIVGHEVKTARQQGWSTIKNGELLALAAKEFDVFVTVDRNLSFQQNLPGSDFIELFLHNRFYNSERRQSSCKIGLYMITEPGAEKTARAWTTLKRY